MATTIRPLLSRLSIVLGRSVTKPIPGASPSSQRQGPPTKQGEQ